MSRRYLTPKAKRGILRNWENLKAEPLPERPDRLGGLGGLGFPDPEIFELCDQLNALDGVCTLQSCAGHQWPAPENPEQTITFPGNLWLWLDESMAFRFERSAPELAWSWPIIDRVRKLWLPVQGSAAKPFDTEEIVEIYFQGMPTGQFPEASDTILQFFRELQWRT